MRGLKLSLILCLFIPSIVLGQGGGAYRNDNAFDGTGYVVGNGNHSNSVLAVDSNGRLGVRVTDPSSGLSQSVIPVSSNPLNGAVTDGIKAGSVIADDTIEAASTRTVLNLTANAANAGDYIIPTSGTAANLGKWYQVCEDATNTVTLCGTGLDATPSTDTIRIFRYRPLSATGTAADGSAVGLLVSLNRFYQNGNGGDLLKAEDAGHTSGDAGVAPLFVNNRNMLQYNTTDKDYTPPSVTDYGSVFSYLIYDDTLGETRGAVSREDVAFPDAGALVKVGAQAVSAIAQTVGTTGDVAPPSMDLGNRLVTTNAPAGETWWACTGEITTATNTQIKASVASNRHYITAFSCAATSTSPNQIYLTDGSGGTAMDFVNTTSNAVAPGPQNTYPTPLRGSSATGVFVTTITTGGVRCCASGYISTI